MQGRQKEASLFCMQLTFSLARGEEGAMNCHMKKGHWGGLKTKMKNTRETS